MFRGKTDRFWDFRLLTFFELNLSHYNPLHMKHLIYPFILIALFLAACSSGEKALQKGNYNEAIFKAVNRLSSDPDNRKAIQVVKEGYPMAIQYYQEEIDQTLSGNDRFKWGHTLDIMLTVNRLSDEVRRVPAARKLIANPKTYTSELTNVTTRAAEERYNAGMEALSQNTREAARNAYNQFVRANNYIPGFRDVNEKIQQAKDLATIKVIVEPIPVGAKKYEYSAGFFYDNVFAMLNQRFPNESFVNFYTPDEAEQSGLKYPDMILQLSFFDFYIDRPVHFEEEQKLSKQVEEKYQVKIGKDSVATRTRTIEKRGTIKIATDQVASGGVIEIRITDFQSDKLLLNQRIPGEYVWKNQYGIFVGDKEVLENWHVRILNNQAVAPPAPQDMFVLFTKPIFDQLSPILYNYFQRYN